MRYGRAQTRLPPETVVPDEQHVRSPGQLVRILLPLLPVVLLAGAAVPVFYELPLPWPDETLFGDPARTLLTSGKLATPSLSGLLPGADDRTYWVPPGYFIWISAWFSAFGPSLGVMRAASLGAGGIALLLSMALFRHLDPRPLRMALPIGAAVLVAIDPLFIRGSLVGRMDMLTLALMIGALVCVTRVDLQRRHVVGSGALSGLALACHPLGLSVVAAIGLCLAAGVCRSPDGRLKSTLLFAAAAGLVIVPWLLYISAAPGDFVAQFWLQLYRKTGDTLATRWQRFLLNSSAGGFSPVLRLAGLGVGLLGLLVAGRRMPHVLPAFLTASMYAAVAFWGNEMWYLAGFVPFAAAGWVALAASPARPVRICAGLLMLALGIQAAARDIEAIAGRGHHDFRTWVEALDREVIAILPEGTTIFINSIPDPAAALTHTRRHVRWREFSPVPIDRRVYAEWLEQMDVFLLGPFTPDRGAVEWIARNRGGWPELVVEAGGLKARLIMRREIADRLR